jgi:hypothetical protein
MGPVRGDDDPIMNGGNLLDRPQQQSTQAGTPKAADDTLPPEVETDLREQIAELQQQVADMQKDVDDMKALRDKDQKAFDARIAADEAKIAALQKQQQTQTTGLTGGVDKVNRGTTPQTTGANPTSTTPAQSGTPATANGQKPATAPTNPAQSPNHPSWLEQLLLRVAQGVGQALSTWVQNKLSGIHKNADQSSAQLAQKYPQYAQPIDNRIHTALDQALANQGYPAPRPTVAPVAQVAAPVQQFSGPRVVQHLPTVTDEFGTHPSIDLTLGDD